MKSRFTYLCVLALATTSLLNGCTGYRLGTMLPPDIKSVHIPTVINRTDEPLIEVDVTRALTEEIQRDGSLKLAAEDTADAVLTVMLTDYRIVPLRFDSDNLSRPNEYRMIITSSIELIRSRSTNEVLVSDNKVRGDAKFELIGDLSSSKQIGLPTASKDLAHDIVERVVEYW